MSSEAPGGMLDPHTVLVADGFSAKRGQVLGGRGGIGDAVVMSFDGKGIGGDRKHVDVVLSPESTAQVIQEVKSRLNERE